jgi:FkbM family methyltransferase
MLSKENNNNGNPLFLKEYKFEANINFVPPEEVGWERCWHGYYQMIKTTCNESRERFRTLFSQPYYENFVLEIFSLMSIIEEVGGPYLTFFELGSGRAPMSLCVAGAVNSQICNPLLTSYRILAVESEPVHFCWSRDHLLKQSINAEILHGAVTSKNGKCRFMTSGDPAAHMGQSVSTDGNIEVQSYTIDRLREKFRFERINIIHMDLQGLETEAIKGAKKSLRNNLIDYIIIGTHSRIIEDKLKELLRDTHNLVIELPQHGIYKCSSINKVFRSIDDGVHVYKRIGL